MGWEVDARTKGIIYICKLHQNPLKLEVKMEIQFDDPTEALIAYSEIPNPESQIARGYTHEEFLKELKILHVKMESDNYLKNLEESI